MKWLILVVTFYCLAPGLNYEDQVNEVNKAYDACASFDATEESFDKNLGLLFRYSKSEDKRLALEARICLECLTYCYDWGNHG